VTIQAAMFMSIYPAWAWSRHRKRLLVASALLVLGLFVWLAQIIADVPPVTGSGPVAPGIAVAVVTVAINVLYFFGAVAWYVALFVLGFVSLASLWSVAGSLASRQQDLQATTVRG
jgi:hypothetical protein